MKLDILAIGAHPDDVELFAGGTLIRHLQKGLKCGIIDLTKGELGTRGNGDLRLKEATKAAEILGVTVRENLGFEDGFFANDKEHQLAIVSAIRFYQPDIILTNAGTDRHPDHGKASLLVSTATFLAGLPKVETIREGKSQQAWKVNVVYHGIQDRYIKPDFVLDITDVWEQKMKAVFAFSSQFYNPDSTEPETPISSKNFLEFLKARAMEFGRPAGINLAEGFTVERTPAIQDFSSLL